MTTDGPAEIDPRRELWRAGSYEILGDWIAAASRSVLDDVARSVRHGLGSLDLLDLATGTGAVAIEAARRGARVVGIDLTDELLEIAGRRAIDSGVEIRFETGDFDRLGDVLAGEAFDVVTSSFGVIFSPDPVATLAGLAPHLRADGVLGVVGWGPASVFLAPDSIADLLPEPPPRHQMDAWSSGIEALAEQTGWGLVSTRAADLELPFESVTDVAQQLERWSGGWEQLLGGLDALGRGERARRLLEDHLATFAVPAESGIVLSARYHVSVLRPPE